MTTRPGGISAIVSAAPAVAVLVEQHGHVLDGAAPKFCTATSMSQGTPAARMPFGRLQGSDRQVRPRRVDAIDQPQFDARSLSCRKRFFNSVGLSHCRARKSEMQIDDPPLALGVAQQLVEWPATPAPARPRSARLRSACSFSARLGGELGVNVLLVQVGLRRGPAPDARPTRENRSSVNVCGCVSRAAAAPIRSTTALAWAKALVSPQRSDIEKLSSSRTMWWVLVLPSRLPHWLRNSGWATMSTTAATAMIRSSNSSSCLRMIQVRCFRWLSRRNSMAAHSTRRWRSMLIRWINTGAATTAVPRATVDERNDGM